MSESLREALAEMLSKRDGGQREYDAHLDAGDAILAVLASFLDQHEAELVEAGSKALQGTRRRFVQTTHAMPGSVITAGTPTSLAEIVFSAIRRELRGAAT